MDNSTSSSPDAEEPPPSADRPPSSTDSPQSPPPPTPIQVTEGEVMLTQAPTHSASPSPTQIPAVTQTQQEPQSARGSAFPYSIEAEAACLGTILIRNSLTDEVFKRLATTDFYDGRHRILAEAIRTYRQEFGSAAFDIVVISDHLKKNQSLAQAGGIAYVNRLIDAAPSTVNLARYVEIVAEKALLRKIILLAENTIAQAKSASSAAAILDELQQKSFDLLTHRSSDYEHIHPILDRGVDFLESGIEHGKFGIPSKYPDLDKLIIGLQPGNLIIIGAGTGMGKTALALSFTLRAAVPALSATSHTASSSVFEPRDQLPSDAETETGVAVGYFSLEMSKQDIGFRILSSFARIPLTEFKRMEIKDNHWPSVLQSVDLMRKVPIHIDDTSGLSMNELIAKARRMVLQDKVGLIIVDYLQLIGGSDARMNREQQVSNISKQLKNLAREMNVPVIALTQLNRAVEQRDNKEPRLSDIRESGAIEQDADIVLLLYRPSLDGDQQDLGDAPQDPYSNTEVSESLTHLFVAKNRNGPTGVIDLTFEGEYVRFVDTFR